MSIIVNKISPRVVDVSHYNQIGFPDPARNSTVSGVRKMVELGIWGMIHKATEGLSNYDKAMSARRLACREAGMLWGTYHFIRPGGIAAQVAHYLDYATPEDNDLVCLDWEDKGVSAAAAREWLEGVHARVGRWPVIYSGDVAKELVHGIDPFFAARRLWLAQYSAHPSVQKSWQNFWLWQYTGDGNGPLPHTVEGNHIMGNPGVDLNHYSGTRDELVAKWAA